MSLGTRKALKVAVSLPKTTTLSRIISKIFGNRIESDYPGKNNEARMSNNKGMLNGSIMEARALRRLGETRGSRRSTPSS
jgi:hypothetical protein